MELIDRAMYLLENGIEMRFKQGNNLYSLRVSNLNGGEQG